MNIMLDSTALMPKRGHATDAGLDLLSPIDTVYQQTEVSALIQAYTLSCHQTPQAF